MFSSLTGSHPFTASMSRYTSKTKTTNVLANFTRQLDFALAAGRVTVTPAAVDKTVKMGSSATAVVNVKNTGGAPATVTLGERDNGFVILSRMGTGAPLNRINGNFTPLSHDQDGPGHDDAGPGEPAVGGAVDEHRGPAHGHHGQPGRGGQTARSTRSVDSTASTPSRAASSTTPPSVRGPRSRR